MGLYSASMLAAVLARKPIFWLWEIAFPDGIYRLAFTPTASAGLGQYHGRVVSSAPIDRGVPVRQFALELSRTAITFECTNHDLQRVLEGSGAHNVRGSTFVAKIGARDPTVPYTDYFTAFSGIVDAPGRAGPLRWQLSAHSDDQPLRAKPKFTPILQSDFPSVQNPEIYGESAPWIYGFHDSVAAGDTGMVPCPYVDNVGFRYLVCLGWAKSVDRVYKDGALVSSANYAITHPTIGGRLYTLIDFTSDQGDTAVITADVQGYEVTGDGSGALLTGVDVLKHWLSNFVYGDWPVGATGGLWLATASVINTTHFTTAQSFLTEMGWEKVSGYIGGTAKPAARDVFDEFCRSLRLYAFFTNLGKLAVLPDDHRTVTLWHDSPRHFRWDLHEVGGSFDVPPYDRAGLATRLQVEYLHSETAGQYVQKIEVRDNSITEDAPASLALPWSHARRE